jgi:phytoene dehydrogenase-like protein
MSQPARKIIIIGAGIAGLCAAVYARRCGYNVEVLEMHESPGGLATNWQRGDYTFETCLHWLYGSNPERSMYALWRQVFDIDKLHFFYPKEFLRLTPEEGNPLRIYTDTDALEKELLEHAPEDAAEIHRLVSAIRWLAQLEMPDPTAAWPKKAIMALRALPYLPSLWRWSKISSEDYGKRFSHPLLRRLFGDGEMGQLSALALILMLAWFNQRNAAYAIGGSQAIIRLIVEKLESLGGHLRCGAKIEKILVEDDAAIGVQLVGGEIIKSDWVVSAADGHATIYDLLGGKYSDAGIDSAYRMLDAFPSYLQVSLGVAKDLAQQPGYVTYLLDMPLVVDSTTRLSTISIRIFHFDPTFAPAGKTAVTCFLPTSNFDFWVGLRERDPAQYQVEKQRVADAVINILDKRIGGLHTAIEIIDVSTPATVIRYTGNWRGSMEGWLLTPNSGLRSLRKTLPGLRQFMMAGHWVSPGGGLPSGLFTARSAIKAICKQDGISFADRNS